METIISFFWSTACITYILLAYFVVKPTWTDTIQASSKFENLKFAIYYLNKDFSFNIQLKRLIFSAREESEIPQMKLCLLLFI